MTDCNELKRRYQKIHAARTTIQERWEEIEYYVTPYRGRFFKDERSEHTLEWDRDRVYDSTAVMAHQNLAASIHGSLTSPSIRWFDMAFRDRKLHDIKRVATWIENASEAVHFALQDSNFNLQINEVYQDLVGFGTAGITLEKGQEDDLEFSAIPVKECFFEEDHRGRVVRFYRKLSWTPAQIISKFGIDVPERVTKLDGDGSQDPMDVMFAIYPRNNNVAPLAGKQSPSRRPFAYCYFLMDDATMLGKEGGYYEMPAFVPRWRKTSSSIWGNSPAMFAMADIKTLNRAREIQIIASEKKIDPPIFAEERAIIGDLNLSSAQLTVVRNIDGIRPFDTNFDIFVSREMIDQLQASVRNYFFTDQLNYPSPQAQPMTATEAQIRYELMQRLLGPTLGRLQNDLLDPIVSRSFRMLLREGVIPPPPQEVMDANAQFDIEYLGALNRAQKSDRASSVERFVMTVGNLAQVMPGMLDVVDDAAVVRQLGKDLSIPSTLMLDEKEVEAVRDIREREAYRANEAALQQAEGDAGQSQAQAAAMSEAAQ